LPQARKRFGQHFLADGEVVEAIVAAISVERGEPILEIGPGRGVLTTALAAAGARLTALEIDRDLIRPLRETLPGVTVLQGDAGEEPGGGADAEALREVAGPDPESSRAEMESDLGEEAEAAETSGETAPPVRRRDAAVLCARTDDPAAAELSDRGPAVEVSGGVVRLTGQVANAWEWQEVIGAAEGVPGVAAVDPDIEVAEPESIEDLAEGLRRAVLRYPHYTVFDDINFGMDGEYEVVLLGAVTEPFKKVEIEERVAKVFGVRSVDNRIEVLPLSPNDQDIRRSLYFRIYRDPRFSDRANMVNPPIHIVVSRGVVALTGVVRSALEKRVLESIARSTPGVFRVVNRLQH